MADAFHLLDLPPQAAAVQRLLSGRPEDEKLDWLAAHGTLDRVSYAGDRLVYRFDSVLGFACLFFIDGDQFVFIGDHTTYTVKG